jgi:hypothetical protein
MSGEFMAKFIGDCLKEGQITPEEICASAVERVNIVDERMKEIESLRVEKTNLLGIIRQLGGKNKKDVERMDFSIPEEKLGDYRRGLCVKICDFVESHPVSTPSQIIDTVASMEEQKNVFASIQWLAMRDIISRDENRRVIKGTSWDRRLTNDNQQKQIERVDIQPS